MVTTTKSKRLPENNEDLKKQVDDLTKLVEKLMGEKVNSIPESENFEDDDEVKIDHDAYIKVMSLCPHTLTLSTKMGGKGGKSFNFEKFGQVKRILYYDLVDIIENHQNFLNDGLFMILDKKVIRRHGLDELYTKLLTKENMERILEGNESDAVNLFKTANKKQQESICNLIITEMVNGKNIDLNFVDRLSRVVGFDLIKKVEESKYLRNLNNKTVKEIE